ncbi:unnamed protein product [Closterium sp. NIES-64]|nr:unnamed protein product [Closterium sp. NIES-64]
MTCQPTSDRVTAIAPVALPAANQFPPYLPYTHRNFFFHGTIIPPEANLTYLGNAFEHCLLNASRAPGDYLEQRSAEECGAFFGVAAGDCQPLCSGHGIQQQSPWQVQQRNHSMAPSSSRPPPATRQEQHSAAPICLFLFIDNPGP